MRRNWILGSTLTVSLVCLPGCLPSLTELSVPTQVWAGHEFEVVVAGSDLGALFPGNVGCVLQLPSGFTVHNFALDSPGQVTRDDPALLSLYTVEPGHYLTSFSGSSDIAHRALWVSVQGPVAAVGTYDVKIALAGDPVWTPVSPTDFSLIVPSSAYSGYARTFVSSASPPPFVRSDNGLVFMPSGVSNMAFGDIDGDGNDDLGILPSQGPPQTQPTTWLSRPDGAWTERPTNGLSYYSFGAAFGDFDGDGNIDFAAAQGIFFGDGHGGWTPGPSNLFGAATTSTIVVADIDHDGCDDIIYRGLTMECVKVFRGSPSRVFQDWSAGLPTSTQPTSLCRIFLVADVTGDGHLDILSAIGAQPTIFPGDGQGH
jgi:hypothetical protein